MQSLPVRNLAVMSRADDTDRAVQHLRTDFDDRAALLALLPTLLRFTSVGNIAIGERVRFNTRRSVPTCLASLTMAIRVRV